MKTFESARTIAPLVLVGALGLAGCSSSQPESARHDTSANTCADPQPLEKVHMTERPAAGYVGAVEVTNEGPCAAAYDRASQKAIATFATGEAFKITCEDNKPNAFQVPLPDGEVGYIDYANSFHVTNGNGYDHPLIPGC